MGTRFHILRVASGKDFETAERLGAMGFEAVSVVTRVEYVHRRHKTKISKNVPLLSGFIFADVPDADFPLLRQVSSLLGVLKNEGGKGYPATVSQDEVAGLQARVEEVNRDEAAAGRLRPGDKVQVGSFLFGYEDETATGTVTKVAGGEVTATIDKEIMGRQVSITRPGGQFRAAA